MSNDPGYGDPKAPVGSPESAKRWRLCFQTAVKKLPTAPAANLEFYQIGVQHRAWTLLKDNQGAAFPDFDSFCRCPQPYGLEIDPAKFRAHLAAELGEKAADLITVAPGQGGPGAPAGNRNASKVNGDTVSPLSEGDTKKAKRLRAILRAPEVVQQLYREDRIDQTTAAKLGPAKPTPEKAAKVAEARQEIEVLDRQKEPKVFRKEARAIVNRVFGKKEATPLDALRAAWANASADERTAFLAEVVK